MLALIVLRAFVRLDLEVLRTERLGAVLAFEWQEVDEVTVRFRALLAHGEKAFVSLGCAGHE